MARRMIPAWCLSFFMVVMSCVEAQQQATNPTDLQVLHEMMYSMYYEYDWKTFFPDPCVSGPQGIVCEPDDVTGILFVTQLQFGFLSAIANILPCSFNATIPTSIANLTRLTALSITSCFVSNQTTNFPTNLPSTLRLLTFTNNPGLVGSIPASLGDLKALQRLVLSQNSLQGEIPSNLGNLHSLLQLDLSHNELSGLIPETLGAMEQLVNLDLRYNNLQGGFPVSITEGLHQLQRLAISNNKIEMLPDTFTGLNSLTFMDLSSNELTGSLPPSLGELSNLEDLFLNFNQFEGAIPDSLGKLTSLVRLDLSSCAFSGTIPDVFQSLKNVRFLSVSKNRLSGAIPASLGSLPVLFTLNMDGNNLSGALPFSPGFVQKMGRNLLVRDNPGLCYTTSDATMTTMGLDPCPHVTIMGRSPSPSPNGGALTSPRRGFVSFMVLMCCLMVSH